MRRFFSVLALLALVPAGAAAQICIGQPALTETSSGNVGFGASFFEGGRLVNADATYGGPAFVTGTFRYTDLDDTELSLKELGAGFGYDFDGGEGVRVCPGIQARFGFGLDRASIVGEEIVVGDYTAITLSPGLGIGMLATVNSTIDVAPYAVASVVYTRSMLDVGDTNVNSNYTSGLLQFGARAIFNGRLSLGPTMTVPIEDRNGDITFGFTLSVGVGG
jgi:hypothetical protein